MPRREKEIVQPSQKEIEGMLSNKRLILILDELEQGIRVINDPTIQRQNVAFLQMLSEWGNRSDQVTLFASIYNVEEEPGATLKRVPCCRVTFTHFEDRENVVRHRIFQNADEFDRTKADSVVESYFNIWRRQCTVPETVVSNFRGLYPFTPDLMDLLLKRVPARGGFQGVRGALGFLGHLVRLTHAQANVITPAHAMLEDRDVRTWLSDLDASADLIEKARTDSANIATRFPLASQIASTAFLYTVTSPTGSKLRGCTPDELKRSVLGPDTDVNDFENTLAAFEKYGAHFHCQEGRYYFDVEEQPDAKVEFRSLTVPDLKAREALRQIWLTDVFRDDGSTVFFSDIDSTRRQLGEAGKDRLRFLLAPARLAAQERHALFNGLELRNQVVLLESKDTTFDLDRNQDLLKWAKRQVAAKELLLVLCEPVRTMVHMAMMTSMRIGEILALRWGRVDLDRGVTRIDESYYRGHFSSVKSQRSQRQVPLSVSLLLALREGYEKASPRLDDLVFAARNGKPLRDGNILRRFIYPTCDQLKIPRLSWHALRYLHGTLLSQLGVPVAVAQAQLGHSNPRITLAIYTHVLPGAQRDAVDRLERHLFPNVPKFAQTLCNRGQAQPELTQ